MVYVERSEIMIGNDWDNELKVIWNSPNFNKFYQNVLKLYDKEPIFPPKKDSPASHKNLGWELMTDYIIKKVNAKTTPVVFILWGNFAKSKAQYITNPIHLIISSPHPSPFSCRSGFFGSRPFSRTNEFLKKNNLQPIDWRL